MNTETKIFNVKEKSIFDFLGQNVKGAEFLQGAKSTSSGRYDDHNRSVNIYSVLKDELFISSENELIKKGVELVVIKLHDTAKNSGTLLEYEYIYQIKSYDDHQSRLELQDFKVSIKEVSAKEVYRDF